MHNDTENPNQFFYPNDEKSQDSTELSYFTVNQKYTSKIPALPAKPKHSSLLSFLPATPEDSDQLPFPANEQELQHPDQLLFPANEQEVQYSDHEPFPANEQELEDSNHVPFPANEQEPLYSDHEPFPVNEQKTLLQPARWKKYQILFLALAFVLVFFAGYGAGRVGSGSPTANTANLSKQSAPTNQHFHTGEIVAASSTWKITVNSVKTDNGGQYASSLKSGDTYVVVDISLTNLTSTMETISSFLSFTLNDSKTGQKYDESIDSNAGTTLDGNVQASSSLHGVIAYEVPSSVKSFTFTFRQSMIDSNTYIWDLNL